MCATPTNTLTLGTNRALYQGELPATGWHRHASPVLLMGLSGRFALHLPLDSAIGRGGVQTCHSALVDTGVEHVFDPRGEAVATMYLEPDSPEARSLRPHFAAQGGVIFDPAVTVQARSSMDTYLRSFDLSSLLQLDCPAYAPLDRRVVRSLLALRQPGDSSGWALGRDTAAAAAHLSASRFNHLFRAEMGVSFRSYRVWSQVRAAMAALGANPTLTRAALDAGFVDSSHFSRMFRQTFGMTPSSVLKPLKEIVRV